MGEKATPVLKHSVMSNTIYSIQRYVVCSIAYVYTNFTICLYVSQGLESE